MPPQVPAALLPFLVCICIDSDRFGQYLLAAPLISPPFFHQSSHSPSNDVNSLSPQTTRQLAANLGKDTDTVALITGSIAGIYYKMWNP
ncbi:ADP-ribosylglycohydrolase family protein [Bacillus sp. LBG-1-113]|uniref:ADP-ribosylglycohydrolase family protein n=1 Tax=Bacillus sp. LBG-1-113 TaxID=2886094 RepID=UPI002B4BBFDA|nr:ADP-ribosylglycohydrolase family protein [Bacillus sp. LBG-1-113]MCC2931004.1 ADP-ribosylglycohydrolase family protein [Bacillus sp. LBG-1-113]